MIVMQVHHKTDFKFSQKSQIWITFCKNKQYYIISIENFVMFHNINV